MKFPEKYRISLKWGLMTTVLLCWVVPIFIVVAAAGYLLNTSYQRSLEEIIHTGAANAMEQMEMRFAAALDASKAVSYEGEVRKAYRQYQADGDRVKLYGTVTNYLNRTYSRDENFRAVYITFLNHANVVYSYVASHGGGSYSMLQSYRREIRGRALELMEYIDTGIYFFSAGDQLYMVRNLLDSDYRPYAVLVMLCDQEAMFGPLRGIASVTSIQVDIDNIRLELPFDGAAEPGEEMEEVVLQYDAEVEGHQLSVIAEAMSLSLWGSMPELRGAILLILLLVLPLLVVVILLFYRHVAHPLDTVVQAAGRVQAGERGYTVDELPPNREFAKLTRHFNSMSTELRSQFDRLYEEQHALQEARIRALQSQINPHFLGNTLEIINWEARLAENDKVSAMIEALSTMLDAAIGRDGRAQISLGEELGYVDAYLYIIKQRLGDRLTVTKEVDHALLSAQIPRLILQPLVENAIDHDVAQRRQSELVLRAYRRGDGLYLEVEHDGELTGEDREKLARLLSGSAEAARTGRVGVRNVNQRLRLLYGHRGGLTIAEVTPGRILAQVTLPAGSPKLAN